jgi:3',5'-cyclic AMP phosphodiesterase CpdA
MLRLWIVALLLLLCSASRVDMAQYAVLRNGINIAAIRALRPLPGGSFSFIVLGDNRDGDNVYLDLLAQINSYADLHIGADKPLFVLHTGDSVAHGTTAEWRAYAELRKTCRLPMVHVRGNHETRAAGGGSNFQRFVGNTMWTFDFGGCRFIGLDNSRGTLSTRGIEVLRKYLGLTSVSGHAALVSPARRSFLVMHEPPFEGRWQVHAMRSDANGGRGGEMLRAAQEAKVAAAFCGHIHMHDEMTVGGVPFVISGGAGAPLYGDYGFGEAEHGFLVVHVTPGGVSWEWVERSPA